MSCAPVSETIKWEALGEVISNPYEHFPYDGYNGVNLNLVESITEEELDVLETMREFTQIYIALVETGLIVKATTSDAAACRNASLLHEKLLLEAAEERVLAAPSSPRRPVIRNERPTTPQKKRLLPVSPGGDYRRKRDPFSTGGILDSFDLGSILTSSGASVVAKIVGTPPRPDLFPEKEPGFPTIDDVLVTRQLQLDSFADFYHFTARYYTKMVSKEGIKHNLGWFAKNAAFGMLVYKTVNGAALNLWQYVSSDIGYKQSVESLMGPNSPEAETVAKNALDKMYDEILKSFDMQQATLGGGHVVKKAAYEAAGFAVAGLGRVFGSISDSIGISGEVEALAKKLGSMGGVFNDLSNSMEVVDKLTFISMLANASMLVLVGETGRLDADEKTKKKFLDALYKGMRGADGLEIDGVASNVGGMNRLMGIFPSIKSNMFSKALDYAMKEHDNPASEARVRIAAEMRMAGEYAMNIFWQRVQERIGSDDLGMNIYARIKQMGLWGQSTLSSAASTVSQYAAMGGGLGGAAMIAGGLVLGTAGNARIQMNRARSDTVMEYVEFFKKAQSNDADVTSTRSLKNSTLTLKWCNAKLSVELRGATVMRWRASLGSQRPQSPLRRSTERRVVYNNYNQQIEQAVAVLDAIRRRIERAPAGNNDVVLIADLNLGPLVDPATGESNKKKINRYWKIAAKLDAPMARLQNVRVMIDARLRPLLHARNGDNQLEVHCGSGDLTSVVAEFAAPAVNPIPRRGVGSSVDAIVDAFLESRPFDG